VRSLVRLVRGSHENGITGRTPAACRQLASSARRRVRAAQPPATPPARHAAIIREFKNAWDAQDITALIGLLDPRVTVTADGGGLVPAALRPIEGAGLIARYIVDLARQVQGSLTLLERTVNGQPGLIAQQDGVTVTVFAFDIAARPDHPHLGDPQPREAPRLDDPRRVRADRIQVRSSRSVMAEVTGSCDASAGWW
jgi:hypothetical protein